VDNGKGSRGKVTARRRDLEIARVSSSISPRMFRFSSADAETRKRGRIERVRAMWPSVESGSFNGARNIGSLLEVHHRSFDVLCICQSRRSRCSRCSYSLIAPCVDRRRGAIKHVGDEGFSCSAVSVRGGEHRISRRLIIEAGELSPAAAVLDHLKLALSRDTSTRVRGTTLMDSAS